MPRAGPSPPRDHLAPRHSRAHDGIRKGTAELGRAEGLQAAPGFRRCVHSLPPHLPDWRRLTFIALSLQPTRPCARRSSTSHRTRRSTIGHAWLRCTSWLRCPLTFVPFLLVPLSSFADLERSRRPARRRLGTGVSSRVEDGERSRARSLVSLVCVPRSPSIVTSERN